MAKKTIPQKIICKILHPLRKIGIIVSTEISPSKRLMSDVEIANDKTTYTHLNKDSRFVIDDKWDYICRADKYANNGAIGNQYFIQDIWGARKILEHKPSVHYDVGSSVGGFIAHLAAQKQKVILFDIRPMKNQFNTAFLNDGGGG